MKRCSNQNCKSAFLYGDTKSNCPFCHSILVSTEAPLEHPLIPTTVEDFFEDNNQSEIPFITNSSGNLICNGRVTEIEHQALFNGKLHKLLNTLFRGEPYQFAHQTLEYTIRVEPATDIPSQTMDFCLFGSYLGRIHPGDEVTITAIDKGDRRIVKSIKNLTTNSEIKPGLQISASVFRIAIIIALVLIIALIHSIIAVFQSGLLTSWIGSFIISIMNALLPLGIMIYAITWILKSIFFPGSHRR